MATAPKISNLPAAPNRQQPANFAAKGDALLSSLQGFATEANALGDYVEGAAGQVAIDKAAVDANVPLLTDAKAAAPLALSYRDTTKTYRDAAAASEAKALQYKNDAASAVVYQNLSSIAVAKGSAMIAGCIDTSLNMPLSVQKKTSWYNEELNTVNRGSRRELPNKKIVIAEGTTITIYDGDDPSCPLWMRFIGSSSGIINSRYLYASGARYPSCVSFLNGILCFGTDFNDGNGTGFTVVDFARDRAINHTSSSAAQHQQPISGRNVETPGRSYAMPVFNGQTVKHNSITHCDMTVLPDAPAHPVSGLPVPVIAVGGDSGAAVFWHDEKSAYHSINTDPDYMIRFSGGYLYHGPTYTSNTMRRTAIDNLKEGFGYEHLSNSFFPTHGRYRMAAGGDMAVCGAGSGAVLIFPEQDYPQSLYAEVRSKFNTGILTKDCLAAFLMVSDTNSIGPKEYGAPTDAVLAEPSSYDAPSETYAISREASLSGSVSFTVPANSTVELDIEGLTGDSPVVRDANTVITSVGAGNRKKVEFECISGLVRINLGDVNQAAQFKLHGLVVLEPNRSMGTQGMRYTGSINRSPVAVGAELVGYGPFTEANTLYKEVFTGLPLNRGQTLYIEGWMKPYAGSSGGIIEMGENVSGRRRLLYVNSEGDLMWNIGSAQTEASGVIKTEVWQKFGVLHDANENVWLFCDGDVVHISAMSRSDQVNTSGLRIGGFQSGTAVSRFAGSLAMVRISNRHPTVEEVRKSYQLEKGMFQPNAKVLLHGGAYDNVNAVACDKETGTVHIGKLDGRSDFSGLVRIGQSDAAITTTVTAHDNTILED